jgi:guanosine-3',5'-bis(diphosphate) 3'-pyrophosphohydrolase
VADLRAILLILVDSRAPGKVQIRTKDRHRRQESPVTPTEEPPEPHRRYAEAVLYSIHKHADQIRRDGSPYIAHPLRVAESLRSIGGIDDMDVILAALMHDLIEDTECEWATIAKRFGKRVADMVAILSGDMRLPKARRRQEVVERIRTAPDEAKAVRLADRLDNLTDMKGFSASRREEYIRDSWKVLEACKGANPGLEQALEDAIRRLEAASPKQPG